MADKFPRQFAVIGAGRFGSSVAMTLSKNGCEVTVVDHDKDSIQKISEYVSNAVQLDATDEKALKSIGIEDVDVAIVSIGEQMEASILVTMALKQMAIKMVVAKAVTESHGKILARVGADKVVFPERDMGVRLANALLHPSLLEHVEVSPGYNMAEFEAPKVLWHKSIAESAVRVKHGVQIVALKRCKPGLNKEGESVLEEDVDLIPSAETVVNKGDMILVIGKEENVRKFRSLK
ncbi:TrkA family potassium uptake protein [bacterium]|nr:TrkA family potassium uptake protein [bacterium]